MTLTCCIIDDEPLAVKLLESYVAKTPGLQLTASFNSAVAALHGLADNPCHLIFCDIQMPDLNGLQFAEMMRGRSSRIVFTTAFSQYALEGWKVDALHYLMKPIEYNDFLEAVNKAVQWFEHPEVAGESMFVKADHKLIRIHFDSILYVEGLKDYVKIYIEGERRPVLSLTSMRAVESALPSGKFLRTHRSFIVNLSKIEAVERGQLVFGDKHIPISDSYRDIVQKYVDTRTLQGRS